MIVKDVSFDSPEDNILLDEALFVAADKGNGGEILRFWESPQTFIVLGRIGKEHEDIDAAAALKDKIPVLRRTSGGGTVVQGRGCLNYTLILAKDRDPALADLRKSYQWISSKIIEALKTLGIDSAFHPTSDIALASSQKKFSGNAQHRGRGFILHHGTILYDFDLSLIPRYLKMPNDVPEYRQNRSHTDFVANIPIDPSLFKAALKKSFLISRQESYINPSEKALLESLKAKHRIQVDLYPQ
jgi:lipoate-protein ligase A